MNAVERSTYVYLRQTAENLRDMMEKEPAIKHLAVWEFADYLERRAQKMIDVDRKS